MQTESSTPCTGSNALILLLRQWESGITDLSGSIGNKSRTHALYVHQNGLNRCELHLKSIHRVVAEYIPFGCYPDGSGGGGTVTPSQAKCWAQKSSLHVGIQITTGIVDKPEKIDEING
jgi:hypothetical protein